MRIPLSLTIVTAIAIAPCLAAQPEADLVALTAGDTTPPGIPGELVSQDRTTCVQNVCRIGFRQTVLQCAGGCAWDTRRKGAWISNGTDIALTDGPVRANCRYQCQPQPLPLPFGPNLWVTGMAYDHRRDVLHVTDNQLEIWTFAITVGSPTAPCVNPVALCRVPPTPSFPLGWPPGWMLTGIAHCDLNDFVYYTATDCSATSTGASLLIVAPAASPCMHFCEIRIPPCPNGRTLGPIVGCAYDACREEVWVTDGFLSAGIRFDPINCFGAVSRCCPNPLGQPYVGICIEPIPTTITPGPACWAPPCPPCTPTITADSEPVIGNPGFSITTSNLPPGIMVTTVLGFGPCTPPGFPLPPPWCAPVLVWIAPPPLLGFPGVSGGVAGCSGSYTLPVSLPPNPADCGRTVSFQTFGICLSAGIGTIVSDCIEVTISSS